MEKINPIICDMAQIKIQALFIQLLRAALNGETTCGVCESELSADTATDLYRLSKHHDLAQAVAPAIEAAGVRLPSELASALQKQRLLAVYRTGQLDFALSQIRNCLDGADIAYVPLKGSVIRPYYPDPSMRTSCDVDILVHEGDLNSAMTALESAGYRRGGRNYHDVSMFSPEKIHLELHFNIQESMDNLDAVLKDAWEHAIPDEGSGYKFSKEFFAFHIFAHMAYHFLAGGCGIRALTDIWVMEHKMGITYADGQALLERAVIYRFAEHMSALATQCFSSGEADVDEPALKYIFKGGIYGSMQNKMTVQKQAAGSTPGYALKRVFLPRRSLASQYPILKKSPYLLPFCWTARAFRALFGGKAKRAVSELMCSSGVSNDELEKIKQLRDQLGI